MESGDSFRLVVRRGPQPNQVYELKDDVMNLGRDITNNISINDREVSRHHLRFTRSSDGFTVEDMGSTNGTFINGKRLSGSTFLRNGDMIGLGETVTLGYEAARPAGESSPYQGPAQTPATPPQEAAPAANSYQAPAQPPAANPYQAPTQPPAANPYQAQPPAANPYQAPQANPYQAQPNPPANPYPQQPAGYPPAAASDPYGQAGYGQADPYAQSAGYGTPDPAQAGYYNQPPGQPGYGAPPPPGYDYDPYAMREQGGGNSLRPVLIGCVGLMIFCCVATLVGFVLIDTFNLYCQLPVINSVLRALGLIACGAG